IPDDIRGACLHTGVIDGGSKRSVRKCRLAHHRAQMIPSPIEMVIAEEFGEVKLEEVEALASHDGRYDPVYPGDIGAEPIAARRSLRMPQQHIIFEPVK